MTKINDLLKFANIFHQEAEIALNKTAAPPTTWSMPDDDEDEEQEQVPDDAATGKYNKLISLAQSVRNSDWSFEIRQVAEVYRKALEINSGYKSISRAINALLDSIMSEQDDPDEENPEVQMVEDVLNEVSADIRNRAGGTLPKEDPPAAVAQLKAVRNAFTNQELAKEMEGESTSNIEGGGLSEEDAKGLSYQDSPNTDLSQYDKTPGAPTQETPATDLSQYDERATSTFDLSGGVGMEARQSGGNSGVGFTRRKTPKDWAKTYNEEKARYQDLLAGENNKLASSKIQRLIDVLSKLETNTVSDEDLSTALMETKVPQDIDQMGNKIRGKRKTIFNAPDPVKEETLRKLREETENLKKERVALKISIKNSVIEKAKDTLRDTLKTTRDPKEKFLLEQEIALRDLQQSGDLFIGPEAAARRKLIASISNGNSVPEFQLNKLKEAITNAAAKKVSREQYNKDEAKRIQQHFAPGEAGKRKRGKPVNFEGKVIALRQSTATQKGELKKKLLKKLSKPDELSIFRSIHDQIAAAVTAGNNAALEEAKKYLKKAMSEWADNQPATQAFIENSKKFYSFLEGCFMLVKSKVLENDIPDAMIPGIDAISDQGNQLILEFNNVEGYLPMVKATSAIVADLELATGKVVKKAYDMSKVKPNTRKKILAELEKNLVKQADDQNNLAGPEQNMDDLCHKVFLDVLRDIEVNGFDE